MLMKSLSQIVRCGHIFTNRSLKEHNLCAADHPVLMFLSVNNDVNQDAIANYFMLDKGTVAKTLLSLETKGLITRTENENNRREKLITLTKQGRDNIEMMRSLLREWKSEFYQGITEVELAEFNLIANKIAENAKRAINYCNTDNKTCNDYEGE